MLVPCFDDGAWIGEALASVRAQTVQDFEILVVDDGSTDSGTLSALAAIEAGGTTVLRTPNRGLPAARNHAARHTSGTFLCALDADDRLAPTWFERGLEVLESRPDVAFVSHWLETFGDEHWTWTPASCDLRALLARNTVNGAALVRRTAFDATGGYDESMRHGCEDWDLWLRLVERGFNGAIVPEVLFFYRRRAGSMSRTMTTADRALPIEQLVSRHEAEYRAHLVDVLAAKELESIALEREVQDLDRDELTVLAPALARAREERAALAAKVERLTALAAALEDRRVLAARLAESERQVADLHASWSWRITAPLRRIYSLVSGR